jgi:hypothetical protein
MRSASVSRRNSRVSSKTSGSGQNVILVLVLVAGLALLQGGQALAALVGLRPVVAVALDLDRELLGQGVHDGDADAVQAAEMA